MKKKLSLLLIALTMIASLIIYPIKDVSAQEAKELDVVLVLDQSGSMKTNDPDNRMKEAAKKFITMMPQKSRANIITFNRSRATWQSGLTEMSSEKDVKSATDWIDNIQFTGDTDMGNAVADAINMFDLNDGKVHAILLFSDGRNDFGYEKNKEVESDERLNDALTQAKNAGVQIYCIGYGDEMANTNDTPYQKLDSIAIANSANRITTDTNADSIDAYFMTVLAELLQTSPIQIVDNKIDIDQNVKEANITISSSSTLDANEIKLIAPDGSDVDFSKDKAKLFLYNTSGVMKLYDPEPGTYTIETSDEITIKVFYIPYYEYVLTSRVLDSSNNEITELSNGEVGTIQTKIQQNNTDVDDEVYNDVTAQAVVTALDNDEEEIVTLTYQNGYLTGTYNFDHIATYQIDITATSPTFNLTDSIQIITNKKPISVDGEIEKQTIDKTFKSSATKEISMKELEKVIDNPDKVDYEITKVDSSDEGKVEATLTKNGIELKAKNWGSSSVTVTYEDEMGNEVTASFTTKVTDLALLIFYASIPFIIALVVLIVAFIIIRRFRFIKGFFSISEVVVSSDINSYAITSPKQYPSSVFLMRRKNLLTGMTQYVNDIYSQEIGEKSEQFFNLISYNDAFKALLEKVKFEGTYLGKNGCIIKFKDPHLSLNNNFSYGIKVKEKWKDYKEFIICIKDDTGLEMQIKGTYRKSSIPQKESFDSNMDMFENTNTNFNNNNNNNGFDDFNF